jgi:hypothetical protein
MDFLELTKEGDSIGTSMSEGRAKIANFEEKFTKFCGLIQGTSGHSRVARQIILKEAETTSDFPTLFGTVLERTIRAKYKLVTPEYSSYVKVGTQNDFRLAWDMALYGNRSLLPVVKERGDYKYGSALSDGKFVIGLQKYGRRFGLAWEAIINDDLGAFSDIADDLILSSKNTRSNYVTKLYAGASGPLAFTAGTGAQSIQTGLFSAAGTHPIDGGSFANYQTGYTLNATNLSAVITALKSQKDYDGNPIMFSRFKVVVPVGLEFRLMQILSNNLLIATALTSNSASANGVLGTTSENILAKYPIDPVTNPWLDIVSGATYGPYSWYVFGAPVDGDAIRFNALRGHEAPEVCQKMSDKITLGGAPISPLEGDFDSDSVEWRVRDIFGGTTTDPRFAYGCQATS